MIISKYVQFFGLRGQMRWAGRRGYSLPDGGGTCLGAYRLVVLVFSNLGFLYSMMVIMVCLLDRCLPLAAAVRQRVGVVSCVLMRVQQLFVISA